MGPAPARGGPTPSRSGNWSAGSSASRGGSLGCTHSACGLPSQFRCRLARSSRRSPVSLAPDPATHAEGRRRLGSDRSQGFCALFFGFAFGLRCLRLASPFLPFGAAACCERRRDCLVEERKALGAAATADTYGFPRGTSGLRAYALCRPGWKCHRGNKSRHTCRPQSPRALAARG